MLEVLYECLDFVAWCAQLAGCLWLDSELYKDISSISEAEVSKYHICFTAAGSSNHFHTAVDCAETSSETVGDADFESCELVRYAR